MPLLDVEFPNDTTDLPNSVTDLIHAAELRIAEFTRDRPVSETGFVPSDFAMIYRALSGIHNSSLTAGNSFCEWGSGFGVVTLMATTLGYSAVGIEIEAALVEASNRLAADFNLPAEMVHGSFVPTGGEHIADEAFAESEAELFWLTTEGDDAYAEIGLEPDDFDVIYAYPWPGEEHVIEDLFEQFAAVGALLLTFSHLESIWLRRKIR